MSKQLKMPVSDEANQLLSNNAFALIVGMILDQQIPLERAFAAPLDLQDRLGTPLTVDVICDSDPEKVIEVFCIKPALHRFPKANAERVIKAAHIIREEYDGDAAAVWSTAKTGDELLKRLNTLPGFGVQKSKIFMGLLGKQLGVKPKGWMETCSPFGDKGTTMSIADITNDKTLQAVRAWKAAKKAAAKQASE